MEFLAYYGRPFNAKCCTYIKSMILNNTPELFFICTPLNGFKYCYQPGIIQYTTGSEVVTSIVSWYKQLYSTQLIYSHSVKWFQVLLCTNKNPVKHQSFSPYSKIVNEFYEAQRQHPIRCCRSASESTQEQWQ